MKRRPLLALAASSWPLAAVAQVWSPPLRMIVPAPPGAPGDLLGRVLARGLAEAWQQKVVIENRAAAAGNIGVDVLARAAPDGRTMGVVSAGHLAIHPALFDNLPYRTDELASVSLLATVEHLLVAGPEVRARSLPELLERARLDPGGLSYASQGTGSQAHLAVEQLQLAAGIELLHVPYKSAGRALADVVGGKVTITFAPLAAVLPYVRDGRLQAVGIASARRHPVLPDLPTLAEQGVSGFEGFAWYALMMPAGTPADVIARTSAAAAHWLAQTETRDGLLAQGLDVDGGTPEALADTIRGDSARWAEVIRRQNIKLE